MGHGNLSTFNYEAGWKAANPCSISIRIGKKIMYNWPKEATPKIFQVFEVESICLTVNTITINFDEEHFITLESEANMTIEHRQVVVEVPPRSGDILHMLGQTVTSSVLDQDDASLILELGITRMRFDGDDDTYEYFHVRAGDISFVI